MVSSAAVPTVSAGFVGGNRTHGSTGGAGDGASYGCWFTAALGKPGDMSSSRLRPVTSPAPYPTLACDRSARSNKRARRSATS